MTIDPPEAGNIQFRPGRCTYVTALIIVFIPWVLILAGIQIAGNRSIVQQNVISTTPSEPLHQGDSITQKIFPGEPSIDGLSLKFGTYKKINHGILKVTIEPVSGSSPHEERSFKIDVSTLIDNEWLYTGFPVLNFDEANGLKLTVLAETMQQGDFVSLWCSNAGSDETSLIPGKADKPLMISFKLHQYERLIHVAQRFLRNFNFDDTRNRQVGIIFLSCLSFMIGSFVWVCAK